MVVCMKKEHSNAGRKEKRTESQIIEAIRGSAGLKSTIIKRLGITYHTFSSYHEKYENVRNALREEEEAVLDMAEGNLFKLVQNGDVNAIFYLLNNKGKKRGYGVRGEDRKTDQADVAAKSGVLVTPGMFDEEAWERQAADKGTGARG